VCTQTGTARPPLSPRQSGRFAFGLVSVLFHAVVLGGLIVLGTRSLLPASPDDTLVELVFEQPVPSPEPEEPTHPVQPSPPPAEAPPEPPPPVIEKQPAPPPVILLPKPEAPPTPEPKRPPQKPRPVPPRPVTQAPVMTPAPRVIAPPVAEPTAMPVIDRNWQASISAWLARKTYPEEARRRGEEGRVDVRFTIDRSGRVVDAAIVATSGSTLLDDAALATIKQAALPPFPPDMIQARVTITTTMRYSLR
jgi:periplasmic protein TonB